MKKKNGWINSVVKPISHLFSINLDTTAYSTEHGPVGACWSGVYMNMYAHG